MAEEQEPDVTAVEGPEGNQYEDMPDEWLYTAEDKQKEVAKRKEGPDLDAAAKAQSATDAGGEASPEHGRPAGAGNALTFHSWKGDEDKQESGD
jgi:hypothetical protein